MNYFLVVVVFCGDLDLVGCFILFLFTPCLICGAGLIYIYFVVWFLGCKKWWLLKI